MQTPTAIDSRIPIGSPQLRHGGLSTLASYRLISGFGFDSRDLTRAAAVIWC
jgi:hypothetical protein